ncbi:hypothetical protein D3C77_489680 [compost metagenome]
MLLFVDSTFKQRLLDRTQNVFCAAGLSTVMGDNAPVKHVNDTGQVEMSAFSGYVTILNIHLPQLVRFVHNTVIGDLFRYGVLQLSLWMENPLFFAETVGFLFVNNQPVFSPQQRRQFSVAESSVETLNQASEVSFNARIVYLFSILVIGEAWNRPTAAGWLLAFRML